MDSMVNVLSVYYVHIPLLMVYLILFLGPPHPVTDCKITNKTFTSLFVVCEPGPDIYGELHQTFVIEVHEKRYFDEFTRRQKAATKDD